ncbi:MAG: transglutaminase domain-containing protein, partial [Gammaproteobacteria bacterium]
LGLEMVTRAEPPAVRCAVLRLLSPAPVRRRIRYELHSVVDYRLLGLAASERRAALPLPAGYHPRARQRAGRWASAGGGPIAIAERALAWYRDNDFVYSLTPPALPGDVIDEFLFETREGFCEHFAASFVTLMRAAGVPARIVTGYQGGEFNSLADYLVIREREAHAWAEIYDDEAGWVRVDPTATVAPERVSLGLEDALPADSQAIERDGDGVASALLVRLRDGFDAITYGWNQWVLGYTTQQQQRLLERFGFEDADTGGLVIALTLALAAATGVLGLLILADAGRRGDPAQQAWQVFCRRLARIGLARAPSEAPRAYAHRVARARADLAAEVMAITRQYTQCRYGRAAGDARALLRRGRRVRPRRR